MISIIQVGSPGTTPPVWRARIDNLIGSRFRFTIRTTINDHWWHAVLDEDNLVGVAGSMPDADVNDFFIGPCGILPEYRGRGLQRSLIMVRESLAIGEGFRRAVAFTNTDNYASANNLIRCGYTLGPPWKPFRSHQWSLFWRKQLK